MGDIYPRYWKLLLLEVAFTGRRNIVAFLMRLQCSGVFFIESSFVDVETSTTTWWRFMSYSWKVQECIIIFYFTTERVHPEKEESNFELVKKQSASPKEGRPLREDTLFPSSDGREASNERWKIIIITVGCGRRCCRRRRHSRRRKWFIINQNAGGFGVALPCGAFGENSPGIADWCWTKRTRRVDCCTSYMQVSEAGCRKRRFLSIFFCVRGSYCSLPSDTL